MHANGGGAVVMQEIYVRDVFLPKRPKQFQAKNLLQPRELVATNELYEEGSLRRERRDSL